MLEIYRVRTSYVPSDDEPAHYVHRSESFTEMETDAERATSMSFSSVASLVEFLERFESPFSPYGWPRDRWELDAGDDVVQLKCERPAVHYDGRCSLVMSIVANERDVEEIVDEIGEEMEDIG